MDIETKVASPDVTAPAAVASLSNLSTDDLLVHLGQLSLANREPGVRAESLGYRDEATRAKFKDFGSAIFKAWERALHNLVCGTDDAAKALRERLLKAIEKGKDAVATVITGALTAYLGIYVAFAAAIGLLLYEIVIKPFGAQFCNFWKLD